MLKPVRGVYQAGGLIKVSAAEEALHQFSHLLHNHSTKLRRGVLHHSNVKNQQIMPS